MADIDLSKLTGSPVFQYYDPSAPAAGDMFWSMASSREGCYIANGADYAQADEPELFAAIGTAFNTQINPTTGSAWATPGAGRFRVPDMRGVVPRGAGTPAGGDALAVGAYQGDTVQPHSHQVFADSAGAAPAGSTQVIATKFANTPVTNNFMVRNINGAVDPSAIGNETRVKARGGNWFIRRFNPSPQVIGAGMATANTPGLVYQSDEIDILSQMTSAQAGATFTSATAIVSKDKNGKWRMKGEIIMGFTSVNIGAGVAIALTIAGISARGTNAVSSWWGQSSLAAKAFVTSGGGTITAATYNYGVTSNSNGLGIHFDFPIDSKPSWA